MAMFDPPHLLKLVRNALGSWKTLIDGQGTVIRWQHIVDLYEYQKLNGFTLANKITKQHVEFEKNKMKVKYAAQVISKSVANSLLTMSRIENDKFAHVESTVKYLTTFDTVFDVMNSRTLAEHFSKAPLQIKNEQHWKRVFESTAQYICTLKTNTGKSVLQSEKYASFLGLDILYDKFQIFVYIILKRKLYFISGRVSFKRTRLLEDHTSILPSKSLANTGYHILLKCKQLLIQNCIYCLQYVNSF